MSAKARPEKTPAQKFREFTQLIMSVPKKEIDEQAKLEKQKKKRQQRAQ